MEKSLRLHDIDTCIDVMRRRKWQILLVMAILFAVSAVVAILKPAVYRSTATILIEEPDLAPDLPGSVMEGFADKRVRTISQLVMTRATLWRIVEKFDLYAPRREVGPTEAIVERLRKDIKLDIVSADAVGKRDNDRPGGTIAFNLSFHGASPEQAQQVANELVSLYLNENSRSRQKKAADVSRFFAAEAAKESEKLAAVENTIAAFKEKYEESLPEYKHFTLQMRDRIEMELTETERQVRTLTERRAYFDGQMARTKEIEANKADLKAQLGKQAQLRARIREIDGKLQQAPRIEREYRELERKRDAEVRRLQDLYAKQGSAQIAQELEREHKGERFSLIDPPQLPDAAYSPKRKLILVVGLLLSIGGGLACAALLETLDHSVRGTRALAAVLDAPVLVAIPRMVGEGVAGDSTGPNGTKAGTYGTA